jgi:hypothetical protein
MLRMAVAGTQEFGCPIQVIPILKALAGGSQATAGLVPRSWACGWTPDLS